MIILAVDDENLALKSIMKSIKLVEPDADIHGFRDSEEAFAFLENTQIDVAFLDIQMRGVNGIDVAKRIKMKYPRANIIFTTGYTEYQQEAFQMHASGYVLKPISADKIRAELDNLRYPIEYLDEKRVRFQTFGNFEVYFNGRPLRFKYDKTKEMLAYLVDRKGAMCSSGELMAVLWEDDSHMSYFSNIRADLINTLKDNGIVHILSRQRGRLGIIIEEVECDLFDWMRGLPCGLNAYRGEYMSQYSWGEYARSLFGK